MKPYGVGLWYVWKLSFFFEWMLNFIQSKAFLQQSVDLIKRKPLSYTHNSKKIKTLIYTLVVNQYWSMPSSPLPPLNLIKLSLFLTPLSRTFFTAAMGRGFSPCLILFLSLQIMCILAWKAYLKQNTFFLSLFVLPNNSYHFIPVSCVRMFQNSSHKMTPNLRREWTIKEEMVNF